MWNLHKSGQASQTDFQAGVLFFMQAEGHHLLVSARTLASLQLDET